MSNPKQQPRWLQKTTQEQQETHQSMVQALHYFEQFPLQTFSSAVDGIHIAYRKITSRLTSQQPSPIDPPTNTLLILLGFGEGMNKYCELVQSLAARRPALTIYIYDHRGQGFSDRESVVQEPLLAHITDWQSYILDAEQFVRTIIHPTSTTQRLHLFTHSTGGMIGTHVLARNPTWFSSATLHAPLFKLILNVPLFDHVPLLEYVAKAMCACGFALSTSEFQAPQQPNPKYDPNGLKLCRDYERAQFWHKQRVHTVHPTWAPGNVPCIPVSPSFGWFNQVIQGCKQLDQVASRVTLKQCVILQAEQDVLVSNKEHGRIARLMPHCQLLRLKGQGCHEQHWAGSAAAKKTVLDILVHQIQMKKIVGATQFPYTTSVEVGKGKEGKGGGWFVTLSWSVVAMVRRVVVMFLWWLRRCCGCSKEAREKKE